MSPIHPILASIHSLADSATWSRSASLAEAGLSGIGGTIQPSKLARVYFVGCGTSFYAGQVAKSFIEAAAAIPAEAVQAYEFAKQIEPELLGPEVLLVAVSQSGDSGAVIAALEKARAAGARTLAITAIAGSNAARLADATMLTGGESDTPPAKTSSYVQSLIAVRMLAHFFAEARGRSDSGPAVIESAARAAGAFLASGETAIFDLAKRYAGATAVFALGSGPNVGTAQEAALKVVEMSKLVADAREIEDFAHGRFRVVDGSTPFLIIAPKGKASGKVLDFLTACDHVKAPTIVLTDEPSPGIRRLATHVVELPAGLAELGSPLLAIIPLYLFAYQLAFERGWDPMSRRYDNFYPQKMSYTPE